LNLILTQLAAREPLFLVLSPKMMLLAQNDAVLNERQQGLEVWVHSILAIDDRALPGEFQPGDDFLRAFSLLEFGDQL